MLAFPVCQPSDQQHVEILLVPSAGPFTDRLGEGGVDNERLFRLRQLQSAQRRVRIGDDPVRQHA
ncbi:hypothetical protein D3C86_2007980 [compost metagenome]